MISAGTNSRCPVGGLRTNVSETIIPCAAFVVQPAVKDLFNANNHPKQFTGVFRVKDDLGTWHIVSSASSFGVESNSEGRLATASVTLADRSTWSPWGLTNADLLFPSNRHCQLKVSVRAGGSTYEVPIFYGIITDIQETITGNQSSITLSLEDISSLLYAKSAETAATSGTYGIGRYKYFDAAIPEISIHAKDSTIDFTSGAVQLSSAMDPYALAGNGAPAITVTGSGRIIVSQLKASETGQDGYGFSYGDHNSISIKRKAGRESKQYNVFRVYGLVGSTETIGEVLDSADVAKRGRAVYPDGYIGSKTIQYSEAESLATQMLAESLADKIDFSCQFNPFLFIGSRIGIGSAAANVDGTATIKNISHSFSAGSMTTSITNLAVV